MVPFDSPAQFAYTKIHNVTPEIASFSAILGKKAAYFQTLTHQTSFLAGSDTLT